MSRLTSSRSLLTAVLAIVLLGTGCLGVEQTFEPPPTLASLIEQAQQPTPDVEATVAARVAAEQPPTAEPDFEATIAYSVEATLTAERALEQQLATVTPMPIPGDQQAGSPTEEADDTVVAELAADYLFADDFETGINTAWTASAGEWQMINGRLQGIAGQPARITVGDDSWQNVTIEATIGGLVNTVSSGRQFIASDPNILFIGVRQNPADQSGYWFGFTFGAQGCQVDSAGQSRSIHNEQNRVRDGAHNVKIEVQGALLKAYFDGELLCSFNDDSFASGPVTLSAFPGDGPNAAYPWVESIAITAN